MFRRRRCFWYDISLFVDHSIVLVLVLVLLVAYEDHVSYDWYFQYSL